MQGRAHPAAHEGRVGRQHDAAGVRVREGGDGAAAALAPGVPQVGGGDAAQLAHAQRAQLRQAAHRDALRLAVGPQVYIVDVVARVHLRRPPRERAARAPTSHTCVSSGRVSVPAV